MSAALKVVRPGLFDTLQDLGRIGYMALGMPTAGAMDRIALTLANANHFQAGAHDRTSLAQSNVPASTSRAMRS